jgi:coenzyme PQQ biosynthesis protein PqqD
MMDLGARPVLASKARLRFDRLAGNWLLLYPERGLSLSATAADILQLCDGVRTVADIIAELSVRYDPAPDGAVERDVLAFFRSMCERGLVEAAP